MMSWVLRRRSLRGGVDVGDFDRGILDPNE